MDKKVVAVFEPVEASVDDRVGEETVGAEGKVTSMLLQPVELQHMILKYITFNFQFWGNASILILSFAAFSSVLEWEQNKDSD